MKKVVLSRLILCQLLMLALISYGFDLSCSLSADGCDDGGQCCAGCFVPVHLADKPVAATHLKLVLVPPVFDAGKLLGLATLPTATIEFNEVRFAAKPAPRRRTDHLRGPPTLA